MKRYIPFTIVMVGVLIMLQFMAQHSNAAGGTEFLGEGGSYTLDDGRHFIVKKTHPFRFITKPGPSYDAAPGDRVWASNKGAPSAKVKTWIDYGYVPEDCKITFRAIDDDPDDRINVFYVGDDVEHDMPQGMVTGGEFRTSKEGNLRLRAEDSIGVWVNKCKAPITPTPTVTGEPTATATATPDVPGPTLTVVPPTVEPKETATPTPTATATKKPRLPACFRINFEVADDVALEGLYEVRELGGRLLYEWYAQEGWTDSGWVYKIDISFEDVYTDVFYVPNDGPRIRLDSYNPSPGTPHGWLSRGICHALEVGWPDETITPTPTPDAYDGYNDEWDLRELDLQRYIWPDIQPTPTETPASSLRG